MVIKLYVPPIRPCIVSALSAVKDCERFSGCAPITKSLLSYTSISISSQSGIQSVKEEVSKSRRPGLL